MDESKYRKGIVTARRDVGEGLWIVRVRPRDPIAFRAGQYVTVGLQTEGKLVERPYTVASAPREDELEFFLELVSGGKLTPHLHHAGVGDEVYLRPAAKGRFLFDEASGHRNHFMVATVTGAAPFVSMIRSAAADAPYRVLVLHGASVSNEFGYAGELLETSRRRSWLEYVPSISRPWLEPGWKGERGRVEDVARKYIDAAGFRPGNTTAYACGNPQMIRNLEGILTRAGFARESIKEEMYWRE
ncbi:MAG: ferredoxin--NADP reductase [Acidobacteriia bacterium]|nr:ferredoxin--NADP reductase [Terriglobia bacterium]